MAAPKGNKNAIGNKGGRPTKFDPSFTTLLKEFFDVEPFALVKVETSTEYFANGKVKKTSEKTRPIPNKLPTLYSFAKSIGVSYWTVQNWMKEGESIAVIDEELAQEEKNELLAKIELSKSYKEAKEVQKEFLMANGLVGASPPAAYIFTAKNVTDMKDKQEVEHSGEVSHINHDQRKRILDREQGRH